jgi:V/A-type H+/Na+-transporting ATPase subunit K
MRTSFLPLLGLAAFIALSVSFPAAIAQSTTPTGFAVGSKLLAAGIAFGLAAFGAGYGIGQSGAAAIAAVVEKSEVRTTALIFVALAEAIAIYGFVMAIIILGSSTT